MVPTTTTTASVRRPIKSDFSTYYVTIPISHGSFNNWHDRRIWKNKATQSEARVLCITLDAMRDWGIPMSDRTVMVLTNRLKLVVTADKFGHWKADVALNVWDQDDMGTPEEDTAIAHSINEHDKAFNKLNGKSGNKGKLTGKKKGNFTKRSYSSSSSSSSSTSSEPIDRGEKKKGGSK